jgi:hypothetical protein
MMVSFDTKDSECYPSLAGRSLVARNVWRFTLTTSRQFFCRHRSRSGWIRPSRKEILAFQPMAESREMSRSFRSMPSGFEVVANVSHRAGDSRLTEKSEKSFCDPFSFF